MKKVVALIMSVVIVAVSTMFVIAGNNQKGDVNKDGSVTSADALEILRYAVGMIPEIDTDIADVNSDGKVNSSDALEVLKIVVGLVTTTAAGEHKVPDLLGCNYETAVYILKSQGFTNIKTVENSEFDDSYNTGQVVKTTPEAGRMVSLSTEIILYHNSSDISSDITAKKEDLLPITTKKNTETLRDSVVAKTIKSGKFTMKANIISGGNKMPATISYNDKDFCIEVTYSQFQMRILSMSGKLYFVMPSLKMYYETTDESTTDLFDFSEIASDKEIYVKTTMVNNLTCEEYKSDEGISRYYFDSNNQWKRFESIDADGTMTVFEISSFTNKVESNLFSLSGFNKMDEKDLETLGGLG